MRGLFEREKCLGLQSLWRREDVEMLAAFWSLSRRMRAVFLIVSWEHWVSEELFSLFLLDQVACLGICDI